MADKKAQKKELILTLEVEKQQLRLMHQEVRSQLWNLKEERQHLQHMLDCCDQEITAEEKRQRDTEEWEDVQHSAGQQGAPADDAL